MEAETLGVSVGVRHGLEVRTILPQELSCIIGLERGHLGATGATTGLPGWKQTFLFLLP